MILEIDPILLVAIMIKMGTKLERNVVIFTSKKNDTFVENILINMFINFEYNIRIVNEY